MEKDIKGFEGRYKISDNGTITSYLTVRGSNKRIINGWVANNGYLTVVLYDNHHKRHFRTMHRLLAMHFINNNDYNKIHINHKDGNKLNNTIENLEWCTPTENWQHAKVNNLRNLDGENHPNSKLTENNVIEIFKHLPYYTDKEIGNKFSVDRVTIYDIRNGRTWNKLREELGVDMSNCRRE